MVMSNFFLRLLTILSIFFPFALSGATRLDGPLSAGSGVRDWKISSDSSTIVYSAQDAALYSVPITGGTPVKLSGGGAPVESYRIAPDGAYVAYVEADTLFSVSTTGGASVQLNGRLLNSGNCGTGCNLRTEFEITPDSSRVVYVAIQDHIHLMELYSVSIEGGTSQRLSANLTADFEVEDFKLSPDGSGLVYRTIRTLFHEDIHDAELFWLPSMTDSPVKVDTIGQFIFTYDFSPDGKRLLFQRGAGPLLGSAPNLASVSLEENIYTPHDSRYVYELEISLDFKHAVYVKKAERYRSYYDFFAVPLDGGDPVLLGSPGYESGFDKPFAISPDGSRVVFRVDEETSGVNELYSISITGGTPTKLHERLNADRHVLSGMQISPDSSRVVYVSDQDQDNLFELFSTPITGGPNTKLNSPLVQSGDVKRWQISPDGSHVIYLADQESDGQEELYWVAITGGQPTKLNETVAPGGDVSQWEFSPDGSCVIYRADDELYTAPLPGIPRTYGEFATFFSLEESFEGDDDSDNTPNGLEYVLGTNPHFTDSSSRALSHSRKDATSLLSTRFTRTVGSDIDVVIEHLNLNTNQWSSLASRIDGVWSPTVSVTPVNPSLSKVVLEHGTTDSRQFYRLKALLNP